MKVTNVLYCQDRAKWRKWLQENHETEKEIWFVFPDKKANEQSVSYNDAVEEALCFGWIDGTAKRLDALRSIRRFTPRRKNSPYSRPNIERLILLNSLGMLTDKVKNEVIGLISTPYVFPEDIIERIKENRCAWENYLNFSEPYKRIRIAYIDAARKRPDEFEKRLRSFIEKTEKNVIITGYGGVDKYYK